MCDERTLKENQEYLRRKGKTLSRRQFSKLSAGAGLGMFLPPVANAQEITESTVMVETPDGTADCAWIHPASGAHAAVLVWPDILGLRPAFRMMGRRMAQAGFSVLTVNPFYRDARAPVVPDGASFADEDVRNTVFPMAGNLNAETHVTDARAFVDWLDRQDAVDTSRGIGTTGYCMGGPMVFRTAAARSDRIRAAATFHGGGLTTDADNSPHLLIPQMNADFLVAIAENDDAEQPESKTILRRAFADAGLEYEVEVYTDTMHGWCPPDSDVYHEAQSERAWSRLMALFDNALA